MAFDQFLADRITNTLSEKGIYFEPKKMMGGINFMVDDKMCIGVHEQRLMARINPEDEAMALTKEGAEEMLFTGRKMKGFIFVQPEGLDSEKDLHYWIDLCLKYNPLAKSSKKKKKKK